MILLSVSDAVDDAPDQRSNDPESAFGALRIHGGTFLHASSRMQ